MAVFGEELSSVALDLMEVLEFGWHDCYGEVTPPPGIIEDILVCSEGRLDNMVQVVRLALTDWRDVHFWADDLRTKDR